MAEERPDSNGSADASEFCSGLITPMARLGVRTSNWPMVWGRESIETSTPASGGPTVPLRAFLGVESVTTGPASASPYPCTSGTPRDSKTSIVRCRSGAPPDTHTRTRPPIAVARSGIALDCTARSRRSKNAGTPRITVGGNAEQASLMRRRSVTTLKQAPRKIAVARSPVYERLWLIGSHDKRTSAASSRNNSAAAKLLAAKARWQCSTPCGRPVVPDERKMTAQASGSQAIARCCTSARKACRSASNVRQSSAQKPCVASLGRTSLSTRRSI